MIQCPGDRWSGNANKPCLYSLGHRANMGLRIEQLLVAQVCVDDAGDVGSELVTRRSDEADRPLSDL